MKNIQIIPFSKQEEARKIFYDYLTELSNFDPDIKFDENKTPIYKWFDCYWTEKERFPLFFKIDNKIAGLSLVREVESMKYEIAEFYVCPNFRKDGNALLFANKLINLFDGEFVFSARLSNPRAIKFWDKFTKDFECDTNYDDTWKTWTIKNK